MKNILILLTILIFSCQKEDVKIDEPTQLRSIIVTADKPCTIFINVFKINLTTPHRLLTLTKYPVTIKSDKDIQIAITYDLQTIIRNITTKDSVCFDIVNEKIVMITK